MFYKKVKTIMGRVIVILIVGFLSACASTRYIEAPTKPPDLGISSQDTNLNITINHLIVTNGEGSWVKDAEWDEYIITFKNISDKPASIHGVHIIDPRGLYINPGLDPLSVAKESASLAKIYGDLGIAVGAQAVGTALFMGGPPGVAGLLNPMANPLLSIVGSVGMMGAMAYSGAKKGEDIENIQREFNKRIFKPFTFSPSSQLTRSSIFPIIPSPKALVVDYRVGTEMKTLEISLEKLAGLHVAQTGNETPPDKEKE